MTKKIMFAGGGTGGHLFPAFALAEQFTRRLDKCEIKFFVTGRPLEIELIEKRSYETVRIHTRGIRRGSIAGNLLFPLVLAYGILEAIIQVIRFNPNFVIGTGGYLSFPAVMAARITSRPAFILEQNSYAGIATRRLARFANLIFIAYEDTARQVGFLEKCILTGNPISSLFGEVSHEEALSRFNLDPDKQTLLVVGGSQGAVSINEKISTSLDRFAAANKLQLLWQVGDNETYIDRFNSAKVSGKVLKFIDDMPAAYAAADLVICRAGALTVSELTATGTPAILVPYPHATEDHQTKNAQPLIDIQAAVLVRDAELKDTDLVKLVNSLLNDEAELTAMSMAATALGNRNAAETIVQRIFEFMGWR